MNSLMRLFPWIAAFGVAWLSGYVYNTVYGGELSWLLWMYREKVALAAKIEAPQRLILAAGSGVHYSVNSELLEQELKVAVFNFGLQGDLGLNVIFPVILDQVRSKDIVVFIPEYLMLMDKDGLGDGNGLFGSVPFGIAIGRPGLGHVPLKMLISQMWLMGIPTLPALTKSTVDLVQKGRMTGYLSDPITEKGDPTQVKKQGKWWAMAFKNSASSHSIRRIAQFRQELEEKGAYLIVSLPWVYAKTDEKTVASIKTSVQKLEAIVPTVYNKENLNIKTDSGLFADTQYHLVPEGRIIRTQELAEQLKPLLQELKHSGSVTN